jgi:hypothetical protein
MLSAYSTNAFFAISRLRDGFTTFPQGLLFGPLKSSAPRHTFFLQAPVFLFQLFHTLHQGRVHATVLSPLFVKCRATHTVFAAKDWHGLAAFCFLQYR